jgi:hypothetical protein
MVDGPFHAPQSLQLLHFDVIIQYPRDCKIFRVNTVAIVLNTFPDRWRRRRQNEFTF